MSITTKNLSNLPCTRMAWSELKQRDVLARAAVDCSKDCGRCGFSAQEQARRLEKGHWEMRGPVRTLVFPAAKV